MKLNIPLVVLGAASAFSSVAAAPTVETGNGLVACSSGQDDLAKRTWLPWGSSGGWCFGLWGLSIGNCGCWTQQNWYDYKTACQKFGYLSKNIWSGLSWGYQWGWQVIQDSEWCYYGKWWLPKDCNKWGFECPDSWKPTASCPQSWLDGYHKACSKGGYQPHGWWDSSKNGYWFYWKGQFIFQTSWTLTKTGYCVPKSEAGSW